MPPQKKQRKGVASQSRKAAAPAPPPNAEHPAEETEFAQLARQHWLKTTKKTTKVKVKNDVLKRDIWDGLEKEDFPLKSLLALEGLQILERYG